MASLVGAGIIGLTGDFASRHGTINHIASALAAVFGLASGLCSLTQYLPLMILYMSVAGLLEAMLWVILPLMVNDLTGGINVDYVFFSDGFYYPLLDILLVHPPWVSNKSNVFLTFFFHKPSLCFGKLYGIFVFFSVSNLNHTINKRSILITDLNNTGSRMHTIYSANKISKPPAPS